MPCSPHADSEAGIGPDRNDAEQGQETANFVTTVSLSIPNLPFEAGDAGRGVWINILKDQSLDCCGLECSSDCNVGFKNQG